MQLLWLWIGRKNKLDEHLANLHKPSDKLKCKICNSEFTSDQLLEKHTNDIHLKKKRLSCSICSYKSIYSQNLRRYISAQHKDQKRYFCNLCGFESYYSCNVKSRITSNHKESKLAKVRTGKENRLWKLQTWYRAHQMQKKPYQSDAWPG